MKPTYYQYYFEDDPTDNKYKIKIKYKDMAIEDNRVTIQPKSNSFARIQ